VFDLSFFPFSTSENAQEQTQRERSRKRDKISRVGDSKLFRQKNKIQPSKNTQVKSRGACCFARFR